MRISAQTLTGKVVHLDVEPEDFILDIKTKICEKEGVPPGQQSLTYHGRQLGDEKTVAECNIREENFIELRLRLRGMISTFTSNDLSDPLDQYLLLDDDIFPYADVPLKELIKKAHVECAYSTDCMYMNSSGVLSDDHIRRLDDFLSFIDSLAEYQSISDIRMVFPDDLFVLLLNIDSNQLQLLKNLQGPDPEGSEILRLQEELYPNGKGKIALRTTKGPISTCISFHADGNYASRTVQVPLNDTYKGGKLCFFFDKKVVVPPRNPGSLTRHSRDVLHAVTSVQAGTRHSLFIVDQSNGLGERDVITITKDTVQKFIRHHASAVILGSIDPRVIDQDKQPCDEAVQLKTELKESSRVVEELLEQVEDLRVHNEQLSESNDRLMAKSSVLRTMSMRDIDDLKSQLNSSLAALELRKEEIFAEEVVKKMCILCQEKEKSILLLPCKHMCICDTCSTNPRVILCPVCRTHIIEKLNIFY